MADRRGSRRPRQRSVPPRRDPAAPGAATLELSISGLAAGGDGVGRDAGGRVTFVPRTAPGDLVRVAVQQETASFARAELLAVLRPGPARRPSPCAAFDAGCGGCQWLHVTDEAQRDAKHALVAGALRKLPELQLAPILAAAPPLGWRRRARFHVRAGQLGLYAARSHHVLPIERCQQLDDRLAALLPHLAAAPAGRRARAGGVDQRPDRAGARRALLAGGAGARRARGRGRARHRHRRLRGAGDRARARPVGPRRCVRAGQRAGQRRHPGGGGGGAGPWARPRGAGVVRWRRQPHPRHRRGGLAGGGVRRGGAGAADARRRAARGRGAGGVAPARPAARHLRRRRAGSAARWRP
ncbi:MAG: TRAM domain-containing protein [Myxococcales bacterium]|nr:TRAM domain-containing protein [Myxococcales bacterium]